MRPPGLYPGSPVGSVGEGLGPTCCLLPEAHPHFLGVSLHHHLIINQHFLIFMIPVNSGTQTRSIRTIRSLILVFSATVIPPNISLSTFKSSFKQEWVMADITALPLEGLFSASSERPSSEGQEVRAAAAF